MFSVYVCDTPSHRPALSVPKRTVRNFAANLIKRVDPFIRDGISMTIQRYERYELLHVTLDLFQRILAFAEVAKCLKGTHKRNESERRFV